MSIPHFRLPFRVTNGSVDTIEQDSLDEIAQCVQVLLSTELGTRLELPDYGIAQPLFMTKIDFSAVLAQLDKWEPRARTVINSDIDSTDELLRSLRLEVGQNNVQH